MIAYIKEVCTEEEGQEGECHIDCEDSECQWIPSEILVAQFLSDKIYLL